MSSARTIPLIATGLWLLACASFGTTPAAPTDGPVVVTVEEDGSFTPAEVVVRPGTTVVWELSDRYRDSIAPLKGEPGTDPCGAIAPYTGEPDDFTGPMPRNPSGIFVLNQDGPGLKPTGDRLEPQGEVGGIMDESWASPNNVGGYLRLRWNWLQPTAEGQYDWTILDREVEKAVSNGKVYSLVVKAGYHGTPDWIFEAGVDKVTFRDFGTHAGVDECKCGAFFELGDPTDDRYQELYFAMLEAVAEHLRSNAAWYRHLAYIKPSGANLYSAENRLPKRCTCEAQCPGQPCKVPKPFQDAPNLASDGRICNTKVWADAGYTPEGLYRFYDRQLDLLARAFPDKDMAYLLIQDGFPRVGGPRSWLQCDEGREARGVPRPTEQTREILRRGWRDHRERFAIMHAGLREGHAVNNMLRKERQASQIVGLQTVNDVDRADRLDPVLRNGFDNVEATFVEVYEGAVWDADRKRSNVLEKWNQALHDRRRRASRPEGPLRDPFPARHSHTFQRPETYRYVNPYRCAGSDDPVGVVRVVSER